MKRLAALAIGIGLIGNGAASAELLKFPDMMGAYGTDLFNCISAQKNGIELKRETNTKLKGPNQLLEKRVFVSRQNDVYLMHELVALIDEYGEWQLACYEAVPK